MTGASEISFYSFLAIYVLLIFILILMKVFRISSVNQLFFASIRMTVQLILAGYILTYLFGNPNKILISIYVFSMFGFGLYRILGKEKDYKADFCFAIGLSFSLMCFFIPLLFVLFITEQSFFNPQYTIPIFGMIIGNAMTGITLGMKTYKEQLRSQREQIDCLLMLGVHPRDILHPYLNSALESALMPTINSMISLGIISLPGMLTGQILSGTLPSTAVIYQIAIMIAICASVCLTVFGGLYFGQKTLYTKNLLIKKV